jgi:outer membrane protein insertion porin family
VRLEVSGDVLVVIVEERPTVADVDFVGNKEFDKDALRRPARHRPDRRPALRQGLADRAEQELKRQYINRSLYASEVVATVTPIERNRVNLSPSRHRGRAGQDQGNPHRRQQGVQRIHAAGLFDLDTGGWLSWYTKSDRIRVPSSMPTSKRCAPTT